MRGSRFCVFDWEMRGARRGLGIAAFETRFFAVSHCRSLRGHTFCVNRKYAKSHKRGGDCDFPAPFETPPLNRQRGTVRGSPLIPSKGWQSFSKPASFFVPSLFFAKKSVGNVKHCTNLRGFQKGDRNPTSVVAGEGSQGEGESKHPLPVRLFGDFLCEQKVTPRSDPQ